MIDPYSDATLQAMLVVNGMSVPGAVQVITGQAVVSGDDRKKLCELLRNLILHNGKTVWRPRY
jgi:hypothetical protein